MKPSELAMEISEKLQKLYDATYQYVREHQGERGYIDTQDESNDCIYAMHCNNRDGTFCEYKVRAVRCNEETRLLQIVCEDISFRGNYQPDDFELTEEDISHAEWLDLDSWGEVLWPEIVWSIASSIEEYVE